MLTLGAYRYDPLAGELATCGSRTRLEPRAAQVLNMLIAHRGEVVSRAALLATVWGGRPVVDEVITRCIVQLRRAFGDRPPHQYIETLHKRGYRFTARVTDDPRHRIPAPAADVLRTVHPAH
jgi:DNA-binding winged helix-turn-helix (wHTH) protein